MMKKSALDSLLLVLLFSFLSVTSAQNRCGCHTASCPSGISFNNVVVADDQNIAGSPSHSSTGIVNGADFTVDDIIWLEVYKQTGGSGTTTKSSFYQFNESRTSHYLAADLKVAEVTFDVPSPVSTAIAAGCFCPTSGLDTVVGTPITAFSTAATWATGSASAHACSVDAAAPSAFEITLTHVPSGFATIPSWGSSPTPPTTLSGVDRGFSSSDDGFLEEGKSDILLFGNVCGECYEAPTASPTTNPTTSSPTSSPQTTGPSVSPTAKPTQLPTTSPTVPVAEPAGFFDEQNNIYYVAGGAGGFVVLVLALLTLRAWRRNGGSGRGTTAMSDPVDIENTKKGVRGRGGKAPDPTKTASIRLDVDDEIFDWEKHIDKDSGEVYFFNPKTGESQWDPPTVKKR